VSTRLASAPVTWGVWELTIGRDDLVAPEAMLEAVHELGYPGIELGPLGYFGDSPGAVGELLAAHGLELVGAFVEVHLASADDFERDLPVLDQTIDILRAASCPLVLADAGSPERRSSCGRLDELQRTTLDGDRFAAAMDRLRRAAARSLDAGVPVTFHHHAATYVETREEVERLLAATEPELGLCVDTGHAVIGGIDPLELAAAARDRLTHVHLKDVKPEVLARLRRGDVDLDEAWEQGLFCPFGEGEVDLPGFLSVPAVRAFEGWVVNEQDRVRVTARDLGGVVETERRNRELVLAWSGWDHASAAS
jgi:inosose dehydratase